MKLLKCATLLTTFLLMLMVISLTTTIALAQGGGHLWFYSQDPDTLLGPQPLPNPQDYDPKYVDTDPDPWLLQSVVIPSANWEAPFTIWLACAQFESIDTKLVVSINDAAEGVIDNIMVTIDSTPTVLDPTSFDTSGVSPGCLAPHGVFNSAEFYGYAEADVGDLYSPPDSPYKKKITVDINLKGGVEVPSDAKIHFDAYGHTLNDGCIFSPYSHDLTFVIPELATIVLTTGSFLAFALYAYKRKK